MHVRLFSERRSFDYHVCARELHERLLMSIDILFDSVSDVDFASQILTIMPLGRLIACEKAQFFFFSIPGRFVTSPGSLVRCRDDRNQQHGTTPKTNQPTTNERTRRQTNQRRNEQTNEQNKRTNTDNETNKPGPTTKTLQRRTHSL